ncbi:MAG: outer membrane protein assembly factor BamB family protein, partial [Methylobacter sp.]
TLIDAKKTTTWKDGKVTPVGENSSLSTWQGDQWKIGGGTTWGWTSYDPKLNLIYYGSGNPSTWNPVQRPGDNKWSMSLWARDADTGAVKWVYQMTPHDEWDFDGINETVLVDQEVKGKMHKTIVHFDRNGFGYTLDRETGELLVAEKFDKSVNWATHVDMTTGRPQVVSKYSTEQNGEDVNTQGVCPAALGSKNQQPVSYSPQTGLFYISGNHLCMDYEPFEVSYTAGQPYVGATLTMMPAGADVMTGKPDGTTNLGQFTAYDAKTGKIVWSNKEPFSVWSGSVATAGGVVFYGTLEGYLKAVDAKTGKELYRFKTPSGIIGNVNTWEYNGKQYVGVLSGIGGWAGIGIAAGLDTGEANSNSEGLGAVGAYRSLSSFTKLGGTLTVFTLPSN